MYLTRFSAEIVKIKLKKKLRIIFETYRIFTLINISFLAAILRSKKPFKDDLLNSYSTKASRERVNITCGSEPSSIRLKKNSSPLNGQSDDADKFCKRFVFHFRGRIRFLIESKTRRLAGNEF